jgi:hypothetical protein
VSSERHCSILKIVKMNGRSIEKGVGVVSMDAGKWGRKRILRDRGSRCVPCGTGQRDSWMVRVPALSTAKRTEERL